MNNVSLMGRWTRDPEVRYTQANEPMAIARGTLAVDRPGVRRDAEVTADFINIVAFGRTAEFIEKYFRQGHKIAITGRIQTGNYTNKDGNKVYYTEVVANQVEFCESKSNSNSDRNPNTSNPAPVSTPTQASGEGFMNIPDGIEDELPFK